MRAVEWRPRLSVTMLLLLGVIGVVGVTGSLKALADDETVTSIPIRTFMSTQAGGRVQGLIWRGGIEMQSQSDTFGGLSGLGFTGPDNRLVMVSDRGSFISGQLLYDDAGRPLGLIGVQTNPILNSSGAELPRAFARDAEALTVIYRNGAPAAVRVGFENLTRVADFTLVNGVPRGPAREVSIPDWLSKARTNETLESVCIAPPASPIAGSTLLIAEGIKTDDGDHAAYLLGRADRGRLSYQAAAGSNPTDCAFLPNGDLLVLERGLALLAFSMRLVRVPAAEVRPGAQLTGEVLLQTSGRDIDNMEALGVSQGPDGETRLTIVSDNNFSDWQRSLLLQFALPE